MPPRTPRETAPKTDLPLAERHVNMSNSLARAAHGLNLGEKRLIACGLASTDSRSPRAFNESAIRGGWLVRITAMEYAEWLGITPKTAYEQLRDAADDLIKRQWVIKEGRSTTKYNWLSKAKYHDGEGWVEIEFTHYTAPHLLALQNHFTTYKLKQASALRSVYSWRMLECLASWRDKGRWTPTIEQFHHGMDAPASSRKNFGMLRRSIIEPAVKELREKDGLEIHWKPVKAGRKVTGLDFTFRPDPQLRLEV
jgi:plasmid replication initiation protein